MAEYIHLGCLEELHFRLWLQGEEHIWDSLAEIWDPNDDENIEAITATIDNGYSIDYGDVARDIAKGEFPNCLYLMEGHIGKLTNFRIFIDDKKHGKVYNLYYEYNDGKHNKHVIYAPRNP